ncbi:MAG TPA: oligoendopeptidase F [Vicinamibacterales bacterium]|nr:oligoendopeptidase F [Vicinamibacterales bacterium]
MRRTPRLASSCAAALAAALLLSLVSLVVSAQERDRAKIPDKFKWDLTHIFPSDAAWEQAKNALVAELPKIGQFKGTLGQSASRLADALELGTRLSKELSRVYVYASMMSDQDTRVQKYQGLQQEMVQIGAQFGAEAAYIEPEILKLGRATIDGFVAKEPRLKVYRFYLDDIQRRASHTLTDAEERLLAGSGVMASAPSTIYGVLSDADFPYPTVTLSDGKQVRLDSAAFSVMRMLPNRDDRQKVMSEFFGALGKFRGTFGTTLGAQIQSDVFYARTRKYESALDGALDGANIPTSVYTRLVDGVNRHLPTFHRYLQLRRRMMKLPELHYYDLYAPLVASVDLTYTVEEAQRHVMASLAPLGPEYAAASKRAFTERWTDFLPNDGKRAGAYSNGGAYDVHPYMLLNFNGKYTDVSTLAHELGHTMHSFFSNKQQPYPTASYPIFVAEVASTFNEELLIAHMLETIEDDQTRLSLLGNYLENIKGTVFRQTQFAEFELRAHQMAEKGQPLTGEVLDDLYAEITRKYYGHDKGVTVVDPYIAHEWVFIPHFYRNFYVFQYATSFTASVALAEKVMAGDAAATARYLTFLGSGGSKYPIDLLKDAGVDMTSDEPLEATMRKMNRVMDEMEKLLKS